MNSDKVLIALNDRITQIVHELEEVETELQKFMARKRTHNRTYWAVKITFPKRQKKNRYLYLYNSTEIYFWSTIKEELTLAEAKRCKKIAIEQCKEAYPNMPHKVSIVKVNVYSLSK